MRSTIYVSGIIGMLLIVIRMIGLVAEFSLNRVFLFSGLILLFVVFLPLIIIERYRHNRKIKKILKSFKGTDDKMVQIKAGENKTKGWDMNSSPYRERKSGLTWEGGNIKGTNATRGRRKPFLK